MLTRPFAEMDLNVLGGLSNLETLDKLLIPQLEPIYKRSDYTQPNKYKITNMSGEKIFFALEDTNCCKQFFLGSARPTVLKIVDNYKREVLNFERRYACQTCLFPCYLQKMIVRSPLTHQVLGTIEQNWSIIRPKLTIKDSGGNKVFLIRGPPITCSCNNVKFHLLSTIDGAEVGFIKKHWSGFCKEAISNADNFSVEFPIDLNVQMKAVVMAAVFLIDLMYYDADSNCCNCLFQDSIVICL